MGNNDNKSIDKSTIIRTLLLILTLINQVVATLGMTSFAANPIYQIISVLGTVLVSLVNAWENNDFTYCARLAGQILNALKDKKLDPEEVEQLLKKSEEYSKTE